MTNAFLYLETDGGARMSSDEQSLRSGLLPSGIDGSHLLVGGCGGTIYGPDGGYDVGGVTFYLVMPNSWQAQSAVVGMPDRLPLTREPVGFFWVGFVGMLFAILVSEIPRRLVARFKPRGNE
jgi:hypothetical protein